MSFGARVKMLTEGYKRDLKRVKTTAALSAVNEAQTPVKAGGRMPVDTGFLRRSIRAAIGSMPSESDDSPAAALSRADLGEPVLIGWTASYAMIQELRQGFMRGAAMNWDRHVRDAVQRVRR
jgi:hypothetical protein